MTAPRHGKRFRLPLAALRRWARRRHWWRLASRASLLVGASVLLSLFASRPAPRPYVLLDGGVLLALAVVIQIWVGRDRRRLAVVGFALYLVSALTSLAVMWSTRYPRRLVAARRRRSR